MDWLEALLLWLVVGVITWMIVTMLGGAPTPSPSTTTTTKPDITLVSA